MADLYRKGLGCGEEQESWLISLLPKHSFGPQLFLFSVACLFFTALSSFREVGGGGMS